MRTFLRSLGILTALLVFAGAVVTLATEGLKLYRELPTPATETSVSSQTQTLNNSIPVYPLSTSTIFSSPTDMNQDSTGNCNPPENQGFIHLSNFTEPPWSIGIWGSENMKNFIVQDGTTLGIIDTNDLDFAEFKIWISSCFFNYHGFDNGDRFWPLQIGIQSTAPSITWDQVIDITLEDMPEDSGHWGLGKQFKP